MNSLERHEARYIRRKSKRDKKTSDYCKKFDDIERVADMNALNSAAILCERGVRWKPSVQRFDSTRLKNIYGLRKDILSGKDVRKGFCQFTVYERGKKRDIQSVHIRERVVQKSLCSNVLKPVFSRNLIYDNGACLEGKGVSFAQERCAKHLRDHFKKYGTDGYALVFDFHSYFPSILHEPILKDYDRFFHDERLNVLSKRFISAFGDIGLGLGSEICQIHAVAYCNPVDHMIKDQLGFHGYGRYMDDGYVLSDSKEKLRNALVYIREKAKSLGLTLNEKKTQIVKLTKGFRFLKVRYVLTETGKVIKLPWRKSITKQRQKLKSFLKFLQSGEMSIEQITTAFSSWLGYMKRKNAYRTVCNMKKLFSSLFGEYETKIYI